MTYFRTSETSAAVVDFSAYARTIQKGYLKLSMTAILPTPIHLYVSPTHTIFF